MGTLFSKDKWKENKKSIENLVLILLLVIIGLVVMNAFTKKEDQLPVNTITEALVGTNAAEKTLEEKLQTILSSIEGAGKVEVLITYQNGGEQVPMMQTKQSTTTTEEADTAGGTRKTEEVKEEQTIVFEENGTSKTPVIRQTVQPQILGVIVVAEGANQMSVKENLLKAIEASLNVPSHRIQVFAKGK